MRGSSGTRVLPRARRAALGVLPLLAWAACASPRVDGSLSGLPPSIHQVESFGLWEHEGRSGGLRVVVTKRCSPEHCSDRSYLQWLEHVRDAGRYSHTEERATAELVELGDFSVVQQIAPAPAIDAPGRFELETANTYSGALRRVCVTPDAPGHYALGEGACPARGTGSRP